MEAPSYEFYVAGGGTLSEGDFAAMLPRASATFDALTGRREVPPEWEANAKHAVCDLVDAQAGVGASMAVASETVGAVSVTYARASTADGSAFAVAAPWLVGSGLLYRGLR